MIAMHSETSAKAASRLFTATILASAAGGYFSASTFCLSILKWPFESPQRWWLEWSAFSASFATPSFINQISLDWLLAQENPQFQIEVGLANLSMGGAALAASLSGWGSRACGMILLIYGLYISCTSLLHIREALHLTRKKEHFFSGENCKFYDIRPSPARIFSHRTSWRLSRGGLKGQTMK